MIEQRLIDNRGFLIALCIALIGAYITVYNGNRNRFNTASDKFKSIVLKELEGLYPIPSNWPVNDFQLKKVLTDKFPTLQTAITEFRHDIPWYKLKSFDRAWYRYYNAHADEPAYENPGLSKQAYHHYMDFGNFPNNKETFRQNIAALLKFTE